MVEKCNLRILTIDDNPSIHSDFIKLLKALNTNLWTHSEFEKIRLTLFDANNLNRQQELPHFEIITTRQDQEAISLIKTAMEEKNPYALVLIYMRAPPSWNVVETIKHIWEIDLGIQIVIYTTHSDYTWEETIENLGKPANLLILIKPFDAIAIRQLAHTLTKKWQVKCKGHNNKFAQTLAFQTMHDPLTQLPNRILLNQQIRDAIAMASINNTQFVLFFLDLDRFKLINNSFSHAIGDELLKHVSQRLKPILKVDDSIARLGGDKFVIIIPDIKTEVDIILRATEILKAFQITFYLAGRQINLTTSIGISIFPKDGNHPDILLRNADSAMYHAKELGGNHFEFYNSTMNEQLLGKLEKEMQLRDAILNQEFILAYQPQFDLSLKELIAIEALIRWKHPRKGIIPPIEFIPLAEETGLIIPIGEWLLRTACRQNKLWQKDGLPAVRVVINVSVQQFKNDFVTLVKTVLEETQLQPEYLEIALTENAIISSSEIMRTVAALKDLGVNIAIDNFGTGYSSLSYLKKIPLDRLKIDNSFMQKINSKPESDIIVRAIIAMAQAFNLEVIAEGVDTKNQLNYQQVQHDKAIQDFYFSKPLSEQELKNLLKTLYRPVPKTGIPT